MAETLPQTDKRFEARVVDTFAGDIDDVIIELRLTREDLAVGGKFPITFARLTPCTTCKGHGRSDDAPKCPACEGTGTREKNPVTPFGNRCPTCEGRGYPREHGCKACEGGITKVDATFEVDVPPGSGPGMQIRVPGEGHQSVIRPPGNVVVVISMPLAPETSPAAQKLPTLMLFLVLFVAFLVIAVMMAR